MSKTAIHPGPHPQLLGQSLDLSPDGTHLALLDLDKQGARILVIAVADGSRKQVLLEPGAGSPISISWAADGQGFFLKHCANNLDRSAPCNNERRISDTLAQ